MSITYTSFVSEIASLTVISSNILVNGDTNFPGGIMPAVIDYAEGRLYRDLDLVSVSVTDTTTICSSGVRTITLSTAGGQFLAIGALNLFSSAGATSSYAQRIPLVPASQAVLDAVYPSAASSNCGQPEFFYRLGDNVMVLGPAPDAPYGTEVTATIRPNALSASNSSTWLTQNVPELMIAAGMIFMSGYMRNFGAQSDDPKMAQSWASQYDILMKTAMADSLRMKFEADAWTSQSASPLATPPRV